MSTNSDDLEIRISHLHDRFDNLERKLDQFLGKRLSKGEKLYLDNSDMMEITGLSYSSLRYYRNKDLLSPVSANGRNRYSTAEAVRFMEEVLHIKLDHYVEFKDIQHLKSAKDMAVKNKKEVKSLVKPKKEHKKLSGYKYIPNPSINNSEKMPKGFSIISYYTYNVMITDYHSTVYERFYGVNIDGKDDPRNAVISKEEAEFVIDKLDFMLVVNNEDGKVWE